MSSAPIILGSESPRRFELLSLIVPAEQIDVVPAEGSEPGFSDCNYFTEICERVVAIAEHKSRSVRSQVAADDVVVCGDTVVVVGPQDGQMTILGKPARAEWKATVREWFRNRLCGQSHFVVSGVHISNGQQTEQFHVITEVKFRPYDEELMEWYLSTQESIGKAGGYGIQGAGSVFVEAVNGSLSNVIGLPLLETRQVLERMLPR